MNNEKITHQKTNWLELIIASSAIFIGLCAFVVSIYQTRVLEEQAMVMKEQQHASVWPRLLFARNISPDKCTFFIRNEGVGPAQINYVEITIDGKPQRGWNQFLKTLTGIENPGYSLSTLNNRIIRQGQELEILILEDKALVDKVNEAMNKMSIDICYSSIYGRCWRLIENDEGTGFSIPYQVESCQGDEERRFLD